MIAGGTILSQWFGGGGGGGGGYFFIFLFFYFFSKQKLKQKLNKNLTQINNQLDIK